MDSPQIALTDTRELGREFNAMELRNLDAMIHLESLARPMQEMASNMARAREQVEKEIGAIEENLHELKVRDVMGKVPNKSHKSKYLGN